MSQKSGRTPFLLGPYILYSIGTIKKINLLFNGRSTTFISKDIFFATNENLLPEKKKQGTKEKETPTKNVLI